MSDYLYIAVKPVNPTTPKNSVRNSCTHVMVGVSYMKARGIVASCMPLERGPTGIDSILIMSGSYLTLASAARLNRKQVETWYATAKNHIDLKTDIIWGLVQKVCAANGLKPSE